MATWSEMIGEELKNKNESLEDIELCTLSNDELLKEFDDGYGGIEGTPFYVWTKNRVYFAVCYDGAEWVDSVPRNPCQEAPGHCGGG